MGAVLATQAQKTVRHNPTAGSWGPEVSSRLFDQNDQYRRNELGDIVGDI
jgi:hypothetical protein